TSTSGISPSSVCSAVHAARLKARAGTRKKIDLRFMLPPDFHDRQYCTATDPWKSKERAIQRNHLCPNGIEASPQASRASGMRVASIGLLLVLLLGCGESESPPPRGETTGRASGAVGPGADSLANRPREDDAAEAPAVADTGWTVGTVEATR